jgi:hypothetical protein
MNESRISSNITQIRIVNIFIFAIILFSKIKLRAKCDPIVYDLIHTILKDYDSSIRPSLTHNSTLNVTFGLALIQLIDVVSFN